MPRRVSINNRVIDAKAWDALDEFLLHQRYDQYKQATLKRWRVYRAASAGACCGR